MGVFKTCFLPMVPQAAMINKWRTMPITPHEPTLWQPKFIIYVYYISIIKPREIVGNYFSKNLHAKQLPAATFPIEEWIAAALEPPVTPAQPNPMRQSTNAIATGPTMAEANTMAAIFVLGLFKKFKYFNQLELDLWLFENKK